MSTRTNTNVQHPGPVRSGLRRPRPHRPPPRIRFPASLHITRLSLSGLATFAPITITKNKTNEQRHCHGRLNKTLAILARAECDLTTTHMNDGTGRAERHAAPLRINIGRQLPFVHY